MAAIVAALPPSEEREEGVAHFTPCCLTVEPTMSARVDEASSIDRSSGRATETPARQCQSWAHLSIIRATSWIIDTSRRLAR